MAGRFYFRHDGDVPAFGVVHQLLYFLLGVEEGEGFAVSLVAVAGNGAFRAGGADGGEPGIFFDFQPPALVFRQVPVDGVYLVAGEQVDDGFQLRASRGAAS